MAQTSRVHPLTQESLRRLRNDGILVDPLDAIELDYYAQRTSKVSDQLLLQHSGRWVGNVEIFPLTLGAKIWLKEDAFKWFELDSEIYYICLLYAMAFARIPEAFDFENAKKCRKAIYKWARTINATDSEILGIASSVVPSDSIESILVDLYKQILKSPSQLNLVPMIKHLGIGGVASLNKDEGTTPIVAWLVANCGQTVEYWLWERSWEQTELLMNATIKQASGQEVIDTKDPSILAMRDFQQKLIMIRTKGAKNAS